MTQLYDHTAKKFVLVGLLQLSNSIYSDHVIKTGGSENYQMVKGKNQARVTMTSGTLSQSKRRKLDMIATVSNIKLDKQKL